MKTEKEKSDSKKEKKSYDERISKHILSERD